MAMTPEDEKKQRDEFSAAFHEDTPTPHDPSDDEAFGLVIEAPAAAEPQLAEEAESQATPGEQEAAAQSGDAADAAPTPTEDAAAAESGGDGEASGEAPAVAVVIEPNATAGSDVAPEGQGDEPTDPKDVQRAKSWEGRLRKREEELAAREKALAEREGAAPAAAGDAEPTADQVSEASAEGETPAEEVAEDAGGGESAQEAAAEAVAQVEDGVMTPDQAIATLTEDFGPEFAKMLGVLIEAKAGEIAGRMADEKAGAVGSKLDGLINELVNDRANAHFESIEDAHPDFRDIGESQEFRDYIEAMPEEERVQAMQTIEKGSARQIIKLLNAYKASQEKPGEPEDNSAADAAEGVRTSSAGMRLPEAPSKAEGYEEAWEKF